MSTRINFGLAGMFPELATDLHRNWRWLPTLGILIWAQEPLSGLWIIGLFVGIEFILVGSAQVMTVFTAQALPGTAQP